MRLISASIQSDLKRKMCLKAMVSTCHKMCLKVGRYVNK